MRLRSLIAAVLLAASIPAQANVFATVHGVVHDPQHRPIAGANVTLQAADSEFKLTAVTGPDGEFALPQAPIGVYRIQISAPGFATVTQPLNLASGTNPVIHIALPIAPTTQSVTVNGLASDLSATDTATPTTLITRAEIDETPGADRTIGMEMITDYVPGAYMTHDMLHMRGGHQTSWLIDGIAIPNTKIASNVGPQIDPKDIDALETQRGSYAADVGDRTYGVFNVLPRNGFERDREGELLLSGGNLDTGETQLSLGNHSATTAWYASLTGSRSNYGLATPIAQIYHDATNSQSGFLSLIRNQTPKDQLRLNAQYRQDYFDIPYDPNPNDWEQATARRLRSPPVCATPKPSATASSSPTGCTPSRPKRCSPPRPSITSTRPTTIRCPPTRPSPPPGIRARITPARRPIRAGRRPQQLLRRSLLVLSG